MKTFSNYVQTSRALNEKEDLQKEYQDVFKALLDKYDAKSPADLSDEKKSEFFNEIAAHYTAGKGATAKGEKLAGKD